MSVVLIVGGVFAAIIVFMLVAPVYSAYDEMRSWRA